MAVVRGDEVTAGITRPLSGLREIEIRVGAIVVRTTMRSLNIEFMHRGCYPHRTHLILAIAYRIVTGLVAVRILRIGDVPGVVVVARLFECLGQLGPTRHKRLAGRRRRRYGVIRATFISTSLHGSEILEGRTRCIEFEEHWLFTRCTARNDIAKIAIPLNPILLVYIHNSPSTIAIRSEAPMIAQPRIRQAIIRIKRFVVAFHRIILIV